MKKTIYCIFYLVVLMITTGCYNTHMVTSYEDHQKEIKKVQVELLNMGYELSGKETRVDNNMHVTAVSYSSQAGYGSAMQNDYITTDKYTFSDTNGNVMSYSVSYNLDESDDSVKILYVTNVNVSQCETSNPKHYSIICDSHSRIWDIEDTPKNTKVRINDSNASWALGFLIGSISFTAFVIGYIYLDSDL